MSGESTRRPVVVVTGKSTCRLVMCGTSAMNAVILPILTGESSTVRAMMKTDTARGRKFGFWSWSSKDGYRSQGSDEESEEGGEMHVGYC